MKSVRERQNFQQLSLSDVEQRLFVFRAERFKQRKSSNIIDRKLGRRRRSVRRKSCLRHYLVIFQGIFFKKSAKIRAHSALYRKASRTRVSAEFFEDLLSIA